MTRFHTTLVLIAVFLLAEPASAQQTIVWSRPVGGNFFDAPNWNPATVPGLSDTAVFDINSTYNVNFLVNRTNDRLRVNAGNVTFNLAGPFNPATYTLTNTSLTTPGIRVGVDANATLNLVGGTLAGVSARLGGGVGVNGTVNLSGADAALNLSSSLRVGDFGNGTLSVAGGGRVNNSSGTIAFNAGSTGSATVAGPGSTWTNSGTLIVGEVGNGTLFVTNGGRVNNTLGTIANASGSTSSATVTGSGSTWTSNALTVGEAGNGTLFVTNGGRMSNTNGTLANTSGSIGSATVNGAGSIWTNIGDLTVGNRGNGTLRIESGGQVNNYDGYIGGIGNSISSATVTGFGSNWANLGNLIVGSLLGNGSLRIENGGQVSSKLGIIGNYDGFDNGIGSATVTGSGSTWTNLGDLIVGVGLGVGGSGVGTLTVGPGGTVLVGNNLHLGGNSSRINLVGGTIRLNGGFSTSGGFINYSGGTVQLGGDRAVGFDSTITSFFGSNPSITAGKELAVDGTSTLVAPIVINGGTFSTGRLVNGSLINFNSGTLRLTLDDLNVGAAGQLGDTLTLGANRRVAVTNSANVGLDGTLNLGNGGRISAAALNNAGRITGNGRIDGPLTNNGSIDEIGTPSAPAELRFTGAVDNTSAGRIAGRNSIYRFDGGLTNTGAVQLSFGTSDVFGDIANDTGGSIIVSGGSEATFWDDVAQNGTLRVSAEGTRTSAAAFFGTFSGTGGATGGGDIFFEGTVSPGNSPGLARFDNDLYFGDGATTAIELAGLSRGSQYDAFDIFGDLSLNGELSIELLNLFTLSLGDEFLIFDIAGTLSGQFRGLNEGGLVGNYGGTDLFITYGAGNGNDIGLFTTSAVPEPGSLLCLTSIALVGFIVLRKRTA